MSHKAIKIGVTALVLATAFGTLLFTTLQDNLQYYKYVDEVAESAHEWEGKTLQVHGYVVAGSVLGTQDRLNWKFELRGVHRNGKVINATYSGPPPDNFKDDAEVVLTGQFTQQGFHATDMTAKCPSKYEEAPPAGPAATTTSSS
jgi:cytochrome c-type biogenesis protein CcmE